ncbi:hypothetical protein BIY21_14630 [Vibrio ponticus]|uniref:Uncharacterized protein n=1 Tax=Vibrio ponticus TaxID=265668 RepID=A0ABX3FFJ2_9VIBR|nr:hypothetical protein [Vibrio ponticus]OLQ89768.1 hypothetical protein BIY21_14630 [Vibrio ponticus]
MQRNPRRSAFKAVYARPLSLWWEPLRNNSEVTPLEQPLPPLMSVNAKVMTAKGVSQTERFGKFFIIMVLSWYVLFMSADLLYPTKVSSIEDSYNHSITLLKKRYGDDYFNVTKDEVSLAIYNRVGEDGKLSFDEYVNYRLDREGGYTSIIIKALFFIITLSIVSWSTFQFFFMRRLADFHFDRERQIVYTWYRNKVMACRFENLGIIEEPGGLTLFMYGEHPHEGVHQHMGRHLLPTDKTHFNTEDDNTYFLATIVKFMEQGKDAILIGDEYQTKQYFFFREDPKPDNFERRLAEVLKHEHALVDIYEKNIERQAKADRSFSIFPPKEL